MGRRRQAYKLEKRGNGIWYVVGTTPDGRRLHRSTRTRSRKAAAQRLPLIVEQEEVGGRATFSEAAPTTEELIAQAAQMIGCGREDSCVPGRVRAERTTSVEPQPSRGSTQARGAEYTVGERPGRKHERRPWAARGAEERTRTSTGFTPLDP